MPELASSLGLDKGPNAALKSKLDTRPGSRCAQGRPGAQPPRDRRAQRDLPSTLSEPPSSTARSSSIRSTPRPRRPRAGTSIPAQRPYPITQQGGAYFSTPDFLNTAHTINDAADAEAYLSRLSQFATLLDNDTADQRAQAARGFLAPAWSIDLALGQMRKLRDVAPEQNTMVSSLVERAGAKGIAGDWQARASSIVAKSIYPALDRQMAMMQQLKPTTRPGDGAWRLTEGEAIYAEALRQATTTNFTPAEVHQMGLAKSPTSRPSSTRSCKSQGYTQGSVGERLAASAETPAQLYADSDAGRAELLDYLNQRDQGHVRPPSAAFRNTAEPAARDPPRAARNPGRRVERLLQPRGARRLAPGDLLHQPQGPRRLAQVSRCRRSAITRAFPGHHLQISISQQSNDIPTIGSSASSPLIRKAGRSMPSSWPTSLASMPTTARARRFPSVLPVPRSAAGCRHRAPFQGGAASRPPTTWSQTTGYARPRSQREVERYCTMIGQACSYKVGHTAWTRARAEAKKPWGRSSTSSSSTKSCVRARCRCRSSSGASGSGPPRRGSGDALAAPERG